MVRYSNGSLRTGLKKPVYGPKCLVFLWSVKSCDYYLNTGHQYCLVFSIQMITVPVKQNHLNNYLYLLTIKVVVWYSEFNLNTNPIFKWWFEYWAKFCSMFKWGLKTGPFKDQADISIQIATGGFQHCCSSRKLHPEHSHFCSIF